MSQNQPLTPDQVRTNLRNKGITLTQWAAERGYTRQAVYRVLNGQLKAHFGRAHEIAVALGMKKDTAGTKTRNVQTTTADRT